MHLLHFTELIDLYFFFHRPDSAQSPICGGARRWRSQTGRPHTLSATHLCTHAEGQGTRRGISGPHCAGTLPRYPRAWCTQLCRVCLCTRTPTHVFVCLQTQRVRVSGGGRSSSRLHTRHGTEGLDLTTLRSAPEPKSRLIVNGRSHLGVPHPRVYMHSTQSFSSSSRSQTQAPQSHHTSQEEGQQLPSWAHGTHFLLPQRPRHPSATPASSVSLSPRRPASHRPSCSSASSPTLAQRSPVSEENSISTGEMLQMFQEGAGEGKGGSPVWAATCSGVLICECLRGGRRTRRGSAPGILRV